MTTNRYTRHRRRLLRDFDGTAAHVLPLFVARYGAGAAPGMVAEARREYDALIPQLPDLGGKRPFTRFLIATAWFLAMYRVLLRHGGTVEEAGQLIYDATGSYLQAMPGFARRMLGYMTFSPRYLRKLRQRAGESQLRKYPGDYVYSFVEGDGKTFDYGVDYTECAGCKFLAAQGAPELARWICPVDRIYSGQLGWGLRRTVTLAEGYDRCDFRFRRGGATDVALPPGLLVNR